MIRARTSCYQQWLKAGIIAFLIVLVSNELILAKEFPISCFPQEGIITVGLRVNEMLSTYQWSSNKLTLTSERNLKESPIKFPAPFKQYGGDIEKWDAFNAGVAQDLISPEFRLDAPFDISPDGAWLVSGVYPAHGYLNYSATNRFALIHRVEKRVFKIIDLLHSVKALTWSPTGEAIAFLLTEDVTQKMPWSLSRWFAEKIGHPISYYNLIVALYDWNGNKICDHLFFGQAAYGGGYLEWVSTSQVSPQ